MGSRFGKKLLKVLEKIGCRMKQGSYLRVDVLDRFLLPLVRLEDLEELLVDFGFVLESVLRGWVKISLSWGDLKRGTLKGVGLAEKGGGGFKTIGR